MEFGAAGGDGDVASGGRLGGGGVFGGVGVEGGKIEGEAFADQVGEEAKEGADVVLAPPTGDAGGAGEVRPVGENLIDHAGTGRAGADFNKEADAIGVGVTDQLGEIEGGDGLRENGVGDGLARGGVRFARGGAVVADAVGGRGLEEVQVAVGWGNLLGDFAVDGRYVGNGMEKCVQVGDELFDGLALAADDAFFGRVDDEKVNLSAAASLGEGLPDDIGRAVDDAQ